MSSARASSSYATCPPARNARLRWRARSARYHACCRSSNGILRLRSTTEDVARALKDASSVAVLTGSGISAESGVPTFRDALTGLWARYDPQELATPEAFRRDPRLVWEWYEWRRALIAGASPNAGH